LKFGKEISILKANNHLLALCIIIDDPLPFERKPTTVTDRNVEKSELSIIYGAVLFSHSTFGVFSEVYTVFNLNGMYSYISKSQYMILKLHS